MKKQRSFQIFLSSLKSEETKKRFIFYLDKFRLHFKIKDYDSIIKLDRKQLTIMIEDYVLYLRDKVGPNTVPTPMTAIRSFLEINDIMINWRRIRRLYPAKIKLSGRNAWNTSDIQKMLQYSTSTRSNALIHFLASTGVRTGALDNLKLKHVSDMPMDCKSVLIYADEIEEYYTFLTPEASKALEQYLTKRKTDGEVLTSESPVFRKFYQIGSAKSIPVHKESIESLTHRIIKKTGLREPKKGTRYDIQQNHGFRKRFNTILKMNNAVNSNIAEKLMGHRNGLDGVYLTPTKDQLFEEFKKAIPELTIDNSERNRTEQKKIEKEKSELVIKSENINKLEKRIEDLEYGYKSREALATKDMFSMEGDKSSQLIRLLIHFWSELKGKEEERRQIFKKLKESKDVESLLQCLTN